MERIKPVFSKIEEKLYKRTDEKKDETKNGHPPKETYKITAYWYLLTQLSYYYRCNLFHGDKPIPLFSYADDIDLKCLRIINDLLESCLDQYLYQWFDPAYLNSEIMPKLEAMAREKIHKENEKEARKQQARAKSAEKQNKNRQKGATL